ncbi:hypothetical protein K504DRAFT_131399 [Pleomassaria siparia CBS 279.74]|uniref:Uncharacterized protein n=1 Tax=Pleomassaria siparia CBS 279.74 TaxID=1314801 RepID=A0A6G1KKX5_9PLEO|nr:hypothetical protein K504DRAFT_131399 [Pleomassaria siparia CBS 279.74]
MRPRPKGEEKVYLLCRLLHAKLPWESVIRGVAQVWLHRHVEIARRHITTGRLVATYQYCLFDTSIKSITASKKSAAVDKIINSCWSMYSKKRLRLLYWKTWQRKTRVLATSWKRGQIRGFPQLPTKLVRLFIITARLRLLLGTTTPGKLLAKPLDFTNLHPLLHTTTTTDNKTDLVQMISC